MGIFSLSSLKVCVNDTLKLNNISHFAIEYDTGRTWKNCCCSIAAPLACALRKTGKRAVIGHNIPLRVLKTYKKSIWTRIFLWILYQMQFKEVVPFCLNSNVLIGSRHLKEGEKHESSFCSLGLYLPTKLKVAHDKKIFLRHHLFVMTLLNFSCFPHVDPCIHTYNRITKCWRSISITNSGMGPI